MKAIDTLPSGPAWRAVTMSVGQGDDARVVVVYVRDVIQVIRDLIGNRRFRRYMKYAPERHWTSRARRKRVFGEMWTGDWWWRMQVSHLSHGMHAANSQFTDRCCCPTREGRSRPSSLRPIKLPCP
jgi:hypothetical protein